jgi:hypothetical protein
VGAQLICRLRRQNTYRTKIPPRASGAYSLGSISHTCPLCYAMLATLAMKRVTEWSATLVKRHTFAVREARASVERGNLPQEVTAANPLTFDLRVNIGSTLSAIYLIAVALFSVIRVPRLLKYS